MYRLKILTSTSPILITDQITFLQKVLIVWLSPLISAATPSFGCATSSSLPNSSVVPPNTKFIPIAHFLVMLFQVWWVSCKPIYSIGQDQLISSSAFNFFKLVSTFNYERSIQYDLQFKLTIWNLYFAPLATLVGLFLPDSNFSSVFFSILFLQSAANLSFS